VGAASEVYFQKQAKKLTLAESLLLTVIPQSPSQRSPHRRNIQSTVLVSVRSQLWGRWLRENPQDRSIAPEIELARVMQQPNQLPFCAPHLTDAVIAERPLKSSMITTVDSGIQNTLEHKINEYMKEIKPSVSAMRLHFSLIGVQWKCYHW
jgi:Membrane carboxypeptidase/penicillin-binding protein PbpC